MTYPVPAQYDPGEISACARVLEELEQQARAVQDLATEANPDPGTWGLVGIPFAIWYGNTVDDVHQNLGFIAECMGSKVAGLDCIAETYEAAEQGIVDALRDIERALDDPGAPGSGVRVGPVDAVRFDPRQDIPVATTGIAGVAALNSAVADPEWADISDTAGSVLALGATGVAYAIDPLHTVLAAGLGFLVDVIQPFEDALAWVTGNPERMQGEIDRWERVAQAQAPMADAIRTASDHGLATWQGLAADAAKQRLNQFAAGVAGTGEDIAQVTYILRVAQTLMEIAQAFVISLVATFVEWLIYTWSAATAAAPVTFGGSTAAAATATTVKAGREMMRLRGFITRVVDLLRKLRLLLTRLHRARMQRVQTSFQLRDKGRFVTGWIGSKRALIESLRYGVTYIDPGQRAGGALLDHVVAPALERGGWPMPPSQAGDRGDQLDPER